jgi:hypothetical protein
VKVGLFEAVGVAVLVTVTVAVAVLVAVRVGVAVALAVGLSLGVGVSVASRPRQGRLKSRNHKAYRTASLEEGGQAGHYSRPLGGTMSTVPKGTISRVQPRGGPA